MIMAEPDWSRVLGTINKIVSQVAIVSLLGSVGLHGARAATPTNWPKSVLITNDNGINDVKIQELARAFSKVARTTIVASRDDKSGTTNFMSVFSRGQLSVTRKTVAGGVTAYVVDGYPADCVLWGLSQLMKDDPPDLVVSGINGGPNLGEDWFGSGTIGAARTAAFLGVRAIAVSGLDDDIPGAVAHLTQWVVQLAQSKWVREMKPGQYLTVGVPRIAPSQIKGVKITRRAGQLRTGNWVRQDVSADGKTVTWRPTLGESAAPKPGTDVAEYAADYITLVPMAVDEQDYDALDRLRRRIKELPPWK